MKKAKRILAVLLAMAMLSGFAAFGVSAQDSVAPLPIVVPDEQLAELQGYMRIVIPLAVLENALRRVPGWLNWAVFEKGSSYEAVESDLLAALKKAGINYEEVLEWLIAGEIMAHVKEGIAYNKVIAEKGPGIVKKHCVFYIDWLVDGYLWVNKTVGPLPLFA